MFGFDCATRRQTTKVFFFFFIVSCRNICYNSLHINYDGANNLGKNVKLNHVVYLIYNYLTVVSK
jgi:hypothetical protein